MDPMIQEWLGLLIRWAHVIIGIAWIGASFYFNWLDSHLKPPTSPKQRVEGELWMVHSGGFYRVEKMQVTPETLPPLLHWFKWEAYFTWITGFLLLIIVYYLGPGSYLTDPRVSGISFNSARLLGIGTLVAGWFVYNLLWSSPLGERKKTAAFFSFLFVGGIAYLLSHILSGRAAYIHVGAMLGTWMAANVWLKIIPAQRELVSATAAGQPGDARLASRAKQRSLHNNYMTLPVVFIMISNHFPSTYGHSLNWLVLLGVALVGITIRHYFNLRNRGKRAFWIWPASAGTVALLFFLVMLAPLRSNISLKAASGHKADFAAAQKVIHERCTPCHSAAPTDDVFTMAPNGVAFDTPEQIAGFAERIKIRAVLSATMPLANKTGMTPEERMILGQWIESGAKAE